jgi:hypothetical protein
VTDVLIRDVPDDVLAAIDVKASKAGLSRSEYLRRTLAREGDTSTAEVTVDSLARFGETFADLANDDVLNDAWS